MPDETKRKYVNVYFCNQEYGGPEEGGWWYISGVSVPTHSYETTLVPEKHKAVYDMEQAWCDRENKDRPPLCNTNSTGRYEVRTEDHLAAHFPKEAPYYE